MLKTEDRIKKEFHRDLEQFTYTREEIVKKGMARGVKFFVTESAIKRAYNRALKELHKTISYTYKPPKKQK